MLKRYLARGCVNTFCIAVSSVLAKGMWFVCMPYIMRILSTTDIGIFDFYQSIFLIGSMIIASISSIPLSRFYLKYAHEPEEQQNTLSTSITLVLGCAALCTILSLAATVRYLLHGDGYFLIFLIVNAGLFACFSLVTSFERIRERLWQYMLLYCMQNGVALLIAICCLRYGFGISSLFWANGISYLVCMPALIRLFGKTKTLSGSSVKEQLHYGLPLMVYHLLYMLLFSIDKWYIKSMVGYELLGLYAVLWYFGRIFKYAAMSLFDASPMLIFNAQHEAEGTTIIARVLRYVSIIYVTGGLLMVPFAYVILTHILPAYQELLIYMPLFIIPLVLIETGRFFQVGFSLSTRTLYVPLISLSTLLIQAMGLYILGPGGLVGVIGANCIAFGCYLLMNALGSARVYSRDLFEPLPLLTLSGCFGFYSFLLWLALKSPQPVFGLTGILLTWPICLWWSGILYDDEKAMIIQQIDKIVCKVYPYKKIKY